MTRVERLRQVEVWIASVRILAVAWAAFTARLPFAP